MTPPPVPLLLDSLKVTSALSILLAMGFVFVVLGLAGVALAQGRCHLGDLHWLPAVTTWGDWGRLCSVLPTIATAYVCHQNGGRAEGQKGRRAEGQKGRRVKCVLRQRTACDATPPPPSAVHPIYVELHPPRWGKMRSAARSAFALCTAVYVLTAVAGYLLFGEGVMGDVLANFDEPPQVSHGKVSPGEGLQGRGGPFPHPFSSLSCSVTACVCRTPSTSCWSSPCCTTP